MNAIDLAPLQIPKQSVSRSEGVNLFGLSSNKHIVEDALSQHSANNMGL